MKKLSITLFICVAFFFVDSDIACADQIDDLITKYYNDIVDRPPDPAAATWKEDIERVAGLDIDIKEGFVALAKVFFGSDEYILQAKDHTEYVTDLYQTFLNRTPAQQEVAAWVGYIDAGLSRNVVFNSFAFSDEFKLYMAGLLGSGTGLPECNMVNDFYRGIQSRLVDSAGFNGWVALMRNAMTTGEQAVRDLSYQIALGFVQSTEYVQKNKSAREFLEDLYNGILRRGASKEEFDAWIEKMNQGISREAVLQEFTNSTEFQLRVQDIIDAASTTAPLYSGFDYALRSGDFWEFQWDYSYSFFSAYSSSSKEGSGTFRVTLGGARIIDDVIAYAVEVSGKTGYKDSSDYSPRWKYLAVANNKFLGSEDGVQLVTLFDAEKGVWPGSGFFGVFASDKLYTASQGTIDNDFISESAIVIGRSQSESQCEYFGEYGTICGGDYNQSDYQKEYYQEDIGPVGYYRYYSISDWSSSDGGWSSSTKANVGMIASSLRGDTVTYELETEPNNSPSTANALTLEYEMRGHASEADEGYELPAVDEASANNSWETAQELILPQRVEGDIDDTDASTYVALYIPSGYAFDPGYYSATPQDWYTFTLDSSAYVEAKLTHDPISSGGILLYLFNYTGSSNMGTVVGINFTNGSTDTEEKVYDTLVAGTYLVAAERYPASGQTTSGERVEYQLELYKGYDAEGTFEVEDWYSFTLTSETEVTITLDVTTASADLDLYLYNSGADQLLATSDSGGDGGDELITTTLNSGTYRIGVNAVKSNSNYSLTVE